MKLVYICSPLRGDATKNIRKANEYSKEEALKGTCPIAPHCLFTQYLNDDIESERQLGIDMGTELLLRCDEILVCGNVITEGMRSEITTAIKNGIEIVGRDMPYEEIVNEKIFDEGLDKMTAGFFKSINKRL